MPADAQGVAGGPRPARPCGPGWRRCGGCRWRARRLAAPTPACAASPSGATASPDAEGQAILRHALERLGLSARAHDKVLRVARTIADLDGREAVGADHVAEAMQYRALDRPAG